MATESENIPSNKKNNEKSNFHDKFMWKLQVLLPKGSETCYTWLKYFLRNTPGPAAQWIETLLQVKKTNSNEVHTLFVWLIGCLNERKDSGCLILRDFASRLGLMLVTLPSRLSEFQTEAGNNTNIPTS